MRWIYLTMADWRTVFCVVAICVIGVCTAFQCPSAGKFVDPENCHNYYVCDNNLQAKPHTCNAFGHFDPSRGTCAMGGDCSGGVVPTTPSTPVQPTDGTGTFQCTSPGRFRDPKRCHDFYICDANLQPTHRSCNDFGYFDEQIGFCVVGSCPEGRPHGFTCPGDGVFADPDDCRAYYMCRNRAVSAHGVCNGGGGYFDKVNMGCVPGRC